MPTICDYFTSSDSSSLSRHNTKTKDSLLISTVEYYELVTLVYETNEDSDVARAMVEAWQPFGGAVLQGQTSRRGFLVSDFL